jgi:type I restriction enzyme S subunit
MERYAKYKDSGIAWLGEIPEHWEIKRLGFEAETIVPMRDKPTDLTGEIPWIRIEDFDGKYISQSKSNQGVTHETVNKMNLKIFPQGTVLCSCSCSMGTTAIAKNSIISNQTFIGINPINSFLSDYLYYFLNASQDYLTYLSTGAIQSYLSRDDFRNLRISSPSLKEQRSIATYLDHKTAEIDELIVQKQRLISLYEEEKTAIINEAVTKGINPDVKLKPSGIDWLGDIPEHWEVIALKRLVTKITDGEHISPKFTLEGMPFLSAKDVRNGYIQMPDDKFVNYEDGLKFRKRCNPELDDILLVSRGATVGRVAIVNTDTIFCLLGSVILLKPKSNINSSYLFYSLKNKLLQEHFLNSSQSSAQQAIYLVDVAIVYLACPPLEEQKKISERIETETSRIDAKITKTQRIIELQKEYRTALISEAVTGKIKVPQLDRTTN